MLHERVITDPSQLPEPVATNGPSAVLRRGAPDLVEDLFARRHRPILTDGDVVSNA